MSFNMFISPTFSIEDSLSYKGYLSHGIVLLNSYTGGHYTGGHEEQLLMLSMPNVFEVWDYYD